MFLSKLMINVRSREFRRDYANVHEMHRSIMSAYPDTLDETPARLGHKILWRLDAAQIGYAQYVQSQTAPDWSNLPVGRLAAPAEVRPLGPVLNAIAAGRMFAFRLVANPTWSTHGGKERDVRKRHAHKTSESQIEWLVRRGERHGFVIPTTRSGEPDVAPSPVSTLIGQKKDTGRITVAPVRFDGHLVITDAAAFTDAVINGVGPAKAYGCGLISIAPPRF
ncbi:type I-E CRISPR-associated protein Cas6/Cse3/CasE [Lentzea guizhouensis]|uniref:Type I-E CRISPR-associated protein Cas6/Cse3/CasE n=1 Tax=Lentzea guizhouensis TaxID=1586287 RepID=A0A1B2HZB8_9PSEU|nr:type I-E CRISPR-associated protein Cas6/Cse3/CasE [Lentzea guizhouensis]ANZ43041.1 type I-E CRISPR-associated protein Cas6/Cse3/CasE [Lentzea guizhouensis]